MSNIQVVRVSEKVRENGIGMKIPNIRTFSQVKDHSFKSLSSSQNTDKKDRHQDTFP